MNPPPNPTGPDFTLQAARGIESQVRDDVVDGLQEWFAPNPEGFALRDDLHTYGSIQNSNVTAVVWRYHTQPIHPAWGLSGDRDVFVHGATFVEQTGDGPRFSRYIQWHEVFADLGVAAAGRIVS